MKILVTGAAGFIASAFVRRLLANTHHSIVALVRNPNPKHLKRLSPYLEYNNLRLHLVYGDLTGDISGLCEGVDAVVHFAAKTFVDHSIKDPHTFVTNNILGTFNILEDARRYKVQRFINISTDECYGSILEGGFDENAPVNPCNPYAAAKVAADALAMSYAHTYRMHVTITRCENVYGPYQHPQKVIPTFVKKALKGEKLPVYGDGRHVRQWLHVDDKVEALLLLLQSDYPSGEVFHIAGGFEMQNIDLAKTIISQLEKGEIQYVDDTIVRPGHDRRYALNAKKLHALGWTARIKPGVGIPTTVQWFVDNRYWLE